MTLRHMQGHFLTRFEGAVLGEYVVPSGMQKQCGRGLR